MLNLQTKELLEVFQTEEESQHRKTVARVDRITVMHDQFQRAYDGILDCLKASVHSREPVGCMVTGFGGTGKSRLAEYIQSEMNSKTVTTDGYEIDVVPAFYASMKAADGLDKLTSAMLEKLHDPQPTRGNTSSKANRVIKLLQSCETRIVFLDELHEVVKFRKGRPVQMAKLLSWIKDLSNERSVVLCLMGDPMCQDIFADDVEMSRRFKYRFDMCPLKTGSTKVPGTLEQFLVELCESIKKNVDMDFSFSFEQYFNVVRMYLATLGTPDYVTFLFKEAMYRALSDHRRQVTLDDFAMAWNKEGLAMPGKKLGINPFSSPEDVVYKALRGSRK